MKMDFCLFFQILNLPFCQCMICIECVKGYFEVQVRERHVRDLVCPACQLPDLSDETQADSYFTFLSHHVSIQKHNVFD